MQREHRFFFLCGLAMGISEIWKQLVLTYVVNNGQFNWWYFPFQLCSIPMYICLILPWVSSVPVKKLLITFLSDFGLLAGIFTFFDTSGLHYSYAPLTFHSYLWHIVLIILGIAAGLSRQKEDNFSSYIKAVLLYAALCVAATGLNLVLHHYGNINMFYISPYYQMNQIVFRDISKALGNTAGIWIYIASIAAGAGIVHWIWSQITSKNIGNTC